MYQMMQQASGSVAVCTSKTAVVSLLNPAAPPVILTPKIAAGCERGQQQWAYALSLLLHADGCTPDAARVHCSFAATEQSGHHAVQWPPQQHGNTC
jgi:hypothetical protein